MSGLAGLAGLAGWLAGCVLQDGGSAARVRTHVEFNKLRVQEQVPRVDKGGQLHTQCTRSHCGGLECGRRRRVVVVVLTVSVSVQAFSTELSCFAEGI